MRKKSSQEEKIERKEREKGKRGRNMHAVLWRFNDRNSSDQEVKSIYVTRATLQEVGILPTLVYFHHKGLFLKYGNAALFILRTSWILVPTFDWEHRKFGIESFIEFVDSFLILMLGF